MRRLVQVIFVICFLAVFSAPSYALDEATVNCPPVSANSGETIDLVFLISGNPGIMAWQVEVSWDESALEFVQADVESAFSSGIFTATPSSDGTLKAIWCTTHNVANDGRMLSVKMRIKPSTKAGAYPITTLFIDKNTINEAGETVRFTVTDGSVTVMEKNAAIQDDSYNNIAGTDSSQVNLIDDSRDNDIDKSIDGNNYEHVGVNQNQSEVAPTNPFNDLNPFAYYYDAVLWASNKGITGGTSADKFSPNNLCSRAQAITFLWRAAGSPEPKSLTNPFDDVSPNAYYYKAVLWAVEQGITNGTAATRFSPDAICSRAQVVSFLWRSSGSLYAEEVKAFSDVHGNKYYFNAVQWAVINGIANGTSATRFSPDDNCNRAQIVTFLYRQYNTGV